MQVETNCCRENLNKNSCVNVISKTKIDECVDSIVKNEGYTKYKVIEKKISADGGNFLGVLSEIDIKGATPDGYKETAIFCKMLIPEAIDMGFLSLQHIYNRELFVYKELSKVINEIQEDANIPVDERYHVVKCFDESYEQALLLDNLTKKGYTIWKRMDIVTLDMAEVCIKQLARLHGTSFALKVIRPNFFESNMKSIKTPYNFTKAWYEYDNKFYKMVMDILDEDLKAKVGEKIRKIMDKYPQYQTDSSNQLVLCHGDYRPNNILIKEKDGKVVDAVPIDFQLMYYSCPLHDFFYFMFMSTDYKFRKAHINHLKNLYYNTLKDYLHYYDISVENVFPRKFFEKMYEERYDYLIISAFFHGPFLFVAEDEELPDVTTASINDVVFKFDKRFKERMGCLIQEFIDRGVL